MKYDEIMDRIEVTPEMRQRVLDHLQNAQKTRRKRFAWRYVLSAAACLAVILCCYIFRQPRQQEPITQVIPQIENVDSLQELSEKTGIPLKELTAIPFEVSETEYVSYWENLAEILYSGQDNQLCYRKSAGTEDNSGDYNVYQREQILTISGLSVTLKGDDSGYCLAIWTDGTYAYSVSVTSPLSEEAFRQLLEANL